VAESKDCKDYASKRSKKTAIEGSPSTTRFKAASLC
jgi:hypothetical protein